MTKSKVMTPAELEKIMFDFDNEKLCSGPSIPVETLKRVLANWEPVYPAKKKQLTKKEKKFKALAKAVAAELKAEGKAKVSPSKDSELIFSEEPVTIAPKMPKLQEVTEDILYQLDKEEMNILGVLLHGEEAVMVFPSKKLGKVTVLEMLSELCVAVFEKFEMDQDEQEDYFYQILND